MHCLLLPLPHLPLYQVNAKYFLDKKQTLGPLDQFKYINKVTNVAADYARVYDRYTLSVAGEYFAENNVVVSASYSDSEYSDVSSLGIGYLISDDFIVRTVATKLDYGDSIYQNYDDTSYRFSASYNLQLQGKDYLGFNVSTDDELDNYGISSTYFSSLGGERFVILGLGFSDTPSGNVSNISAGYYFSKMTSVSANYNTSDNYSLNAKHYFNQNWALVAGFAGNTDFSDYKRYTLGVTGQF
ncbi:MAG: hypothetical protein ACI8R9_001641 [Paraglaciecola sp.]|jgi:hypothetical protein